MRHLSRGQVSNRLARARIEPKSNSLGHPCISREVDADRPERMECQCMNMAHQGALNIDSEIGKKLQVELSSCDLVTRLVHHHGTALVQSLCCPGFKIPREMHQIGVQVVSICAQSPKFIYKLVIHYLLSIRLRVWHSIKPPSHKCSLQEYQPIE